MSESDRLAQIKARWGDVVTVHCKVSGEPGDCVCNLATEAAQAIRWLLAEVEHARQPHVQVWGPASYSANWLPCPKCGQVTYNTSMGVG